MTERFFALPHETKAHYLVGKETNAGWKDRKLGASFDRHQPILKKPDHLTPPRMSGLWPAGDDLLGFKAAMLAFERANPARPGHEGAVLFRPGVRPLRPTSSPTCHDPLSEEDPEYAALFCVICRWRTQSPGGLRPGRRAGAHTDFDRLTLLHQRTGQSGLKLGPGTESAEIAGTDVLSRRPASSPARSATC